MDLYEEARLSFGKVNSEYMIHCFGDSITESVEASEDSKRYPSILQTLVGKDYLVKNHGVAGASTLNIAARQGGIPIHLVNDLTFGSGVTSINPIESDFASNYPSIDSEWSAAIVNPSGFPDFNPAYIDGHKCNVFVTRSGSTNIMSLTLLDVDSEHTDPITLHAGSIVRFNGCNDSNNGITIIMMGTNGGWNWTGSVLAAQYRACANNVANNKYLILSYFDMTYENDGTYETYASVMAQNIDKIAQELDRKNRAQQDNGQRSETRQSTPQEKMFYSSVAYLQSTDDTSRLDEFRNKGNYEGLLRLAKEYYDGNGINEQYTFTSPLQNKGDDLLVEDKDFAVVYNNSVGGSYEVMLKYSEQEIRDHINRYGVRLASDDIKGVAKEMVAEQFLAMTKQRTPVFEMPCGDILYTGYNRETDTLDVGTATNAGLAVRHSFPYDHDSSLESNLQSVYTELSRMEQYQKEKMEYSGGMHR